MMLIVWMLEMLHQGSRRHRFSIHSDETLSGVCSLCDIHGYLLHGIKVKQQVFMSGNFPSSEQVSRSTITLMLNVDAFHDCATYSAVIQVCVIHRTLTQLQFNRLFSR